MAKRVFSGLTTACRFAEIPTNRSPLSVKATTDGVVRVPSAFSIIRGILPSIIATAEFVVPRSMPITWPLTFSPESGVSVEACREIIDDLGARIDENLEMGDDRGICRYNC